MSANKLDIAIATTEGNIELTLYGENSGETIIEKVDALENGEAIFQIKEGNFYEYKISDGYFLQPCEIVSHSNITKLSGRITPNIYVGTLSIDVFKEGATERCGKVEFEVQSIKTTYREDYRHMLEEITEKCTDLLLQHSSPVAHFFEVDYNADATTLYQRFAFIKSILESVEFNDSVHKIISSPVTRWRESETIKDIRSVRRFHSSAIRQLTCVTNRFKLPEDHSLKAIIDSVPSKLKVNFKTETVDTPENRFVKHALISFQTFCSDFKTKIKDSDRIKTEATLLEDKLEQYLSHSIFKEISSLTTLPLNSPILQRKEGYREILRVWLMFDLAAKLVWRGGNDVYSGRKKDVAVLYEYWLFFKLLDIVSEVFNVKSKNIQQLIKETDGNLEMQLRQGKHFPIEGIYENGTRKLNILFSYNRPFAGKKDYPDAGSYTKNMRPDYTLSIWPVGINQTEAEAEELIVHIHFDAKYKVDKITDIFGTTENKEQSEEEIQKELSDEKNEQNRGRFKREDLLKMHAYKDAIRRTGGAYILYPGNDSTYTRKGFHELIPGLGAFAIRPSKINNGTEELKMFLLEVVHHFMNRASQREKMSFKTYETHKDKNSNEVSESLPEAYGANRSLLPDETFVLVGFSTSPQRFTWYEKTGKYIFRMDDNKGSLELNAEVVNAKYLLLRKSGEENASDLFKIKSKGPKVFSLSKLIELQYPLSKNPKEYYLAIEIEKVTDKEFKKVSWKFKELEKYKSIIEKERNPYSKVGLPFTITLTELMSVVCH